MIVDLSLAARLLCALISLVVGGFGVRGVVEGALPPATLFFAAGVIGSAIFSLVPGE